MPSPKPLTHDSKRLCGGKMSVVIQLRIGKVTVNMTAALIFSSIFGPSTNGQPLIHPPK